jgi:hypothetical protein
LRITLILFFVVFLILGLYYITLGEILWGGLVIVLSLVYLFGFEHVYEGKNWHSVSHIFSGGIFAIIAVAFLVIEKLVSFLSEPEKFTLMDIFFIIAGGIAFSIAMIFKREFE